MQPGAVSAALLTPQSAPFISPLFKRGITTPLPVRFTPEETLQEIFPFPGSPSRQIVRLIKHFFPPVGRKEWGERMGEGNKRRVGGGGGAKKIPSNELPRHHDPIKSQHRLSPRFTGPKHRPSGLPSLPPLSFPPHVPSLPILLLTAAPVSVAPAAGGQMASSQAWLDGNCHCNSTQFDIALPNPVVRWRRTGPHRDVHRRSHGTAPHLSP